MTSPYLGAPVIGKIFHNPALEDVLDQFQDDLDGICYPIVDSWSKLIIFSDVYRTIRLVMKKEINSKFNSIDVQRTLERCMEDVEEIIYRLEDKAREIKRESVENDRINDCEE